MNAMILYTRRRRVIFLVALASLPIICANGNGENHPQRRMIRQRSRRNEQKKRRKVRADNNEGSSINARDQPIRHHPLQRATENSPRTFIPKDQKTFTTTFEGNATFAGNMFDIVPRKNIKIHRMGIHTYKNNQPIDVWVYTRTGSYDGAENDISQWTLVMNATVQGQGTGTPSMIPGEFDPPLVIQKNQRQSFYVTTNGPWLRLTKGTDEGEEVYSSTDISFYQGVGKWYPIDGGTRRARLWNGLLVYRVVSDYEAKGQKTFTTTFESDATFAGNMFDIVPRKNIRIDRMGMHTHKNNQPIDVWVYTRKGSYKGAENDISQWTPVVNATVQGQGMGTPSMIPGEFDPPLVIPKNQRQSFYVTTNGPWLRLTKGTDEGEEIYSSADISFYQGAGKRYPMDGGTHRARLWNGLLVYRVVSGSEALGSVTFRRGDLAQTVPQLGIKMCSGMSVRVIARANQPVSFANGGLSESRFHSMPDGAAVFPLDDGRHVYVSNSEMKQNLGGVYGVYFDSDGNVEDYKAMLTGTTRNCGGGVTPWNTWLSCEEYGRGQCWQVDPRGQISPQITQLGGKGGGNYESVAVDNRNGRPTFFISEDALRGALRRYTPLTSAPAYGWNALHVQGGTTEFLVFLDGNRFMWTRDENAGRDSQQKHFEHVEGIDCHDGYLYFVSKKLFMLYMLDLDRGTYTSSSTKDGVDGVHLTGNGQFRNMPDQLIRNNGGGDYLYMTEDGGLTVGVYAIHGPTGKRYAIFEAYSLLYKHDETTGLAFSPDGSKMYASFQDCGCKDSEGGLDPECGCLLEFSRTDGRSFDGGTLGLKFHSHP